MKTRLIIGVSILVLCMLGVAGFRHSEPALRALVNRWSPEREGRQAEKWKTDIQRQFEKRISFDFVDTPLDDVLCFLSSLTGTNIVLDRAALQDGEVPVTLKVNDMRLGAALDWILRLVNLNYVLRDEAVFVSTPERCRPPPVTYAYLLGGIVPREQYGEFLTMLGREISDGWDHDPRGTVKIFGDTLVLHRIGDEARKVQHILDAMGIEPVPPEVPKSNRSRLLEPDDSEL